MGDGVIKEHRYGMTDEGREGWEDARFEKSTDTRTDTDRDGVVGNYGTKQWKDGVIKC